MKTKTRSEVIRFYLSMFLKATIRGGKGKEWKGKGKKKIS